MIIINKALLCCALRFRQWKKDYKIMAVFLFVLILVFYYTRDIYSFSIKIGEPITPWLFPAIFSDYIVSMGLLKVLLYFGVIALFCNAPFVDRLYTAVILRSGRMSWSLGQVFYIFFTSLIYTFFIFISSIAVVLPRITFLTQWGKTIGTLAMTDAANQVPLLMFPWKLIVNYEPLEAILIALLLVWLTCAMIGMILFCLNSLFNRRIGISICCLLILMDPVIKWMDRGDLLRFSPVSWSSIENLATNNMSTMHSPLKAIVLLSSICILLAVIVIRYHYRQPFEKNNVTE